MPKNILAATSHVERRSLLAPDVARWPYDRDRPILSLRRVWKSFGDADIIKNLSLDVYAGQTIVIIGQSGSGKSVLLKLMNGLLRPDRGEVRLFGQALGELGESDVNVLRRRTGMVLQNYALIDSIAVLDNVAFPLVENSRMARREIDARVMDLLEMLGIADSAKRLPAALSGGMKKRVSFARAVITEPELVFFDEPTTGLDPVMIEFVDGLVTQMRERFQITSVIISHDIGSVFRLADRIAMLEGGRIIAEGVTQEMAQSEVPQVKAFISVGGSGRLGSSSAEEEGVVASADGACDTSKGEPLVEVTGVHKRFGSNHVLKGVDLVIYPREITVIIGGSGSGKSVLMKHILGLFSPDAGDVRVRGRLLSAMSSREMLEFRTSIGMLFQGAALFDSMHVWDNVAFPLIERGTGIARREVERRVSDVLHRLRLKEIASAYPSDISAGQRKRVGLARAIVTRPSIMIYDEPTTGQDPIMIRYVDNMIEEAHEEFELTSIEISHDMQSTFRIADRIAMVHEGIIAACGSPDEVKRSQNPHVQRFIFAGASALDG